MLNLSIILEESARRNPEKDAIVFGDKRFGFTQINAAANQVAHGLTKLGVKKGDKVAVSCLNLPYFPIIYYGILKAGAVVAPLNVLLKHKEIAYHLQDSEAKVYFCFEGTPDLPMGKEGFIGFQEVDTCAHFFMITGDPGQPSPIENTQTLGQLMQGNPPEFDTVQTMPDDTAVILYTSGTTGFPKGAELTHANMLLNARTTADMMQYTSDDVGLIVLPLFHSFGQTVQMNCGIMRGMTSILQPRFDPATVLGLMQKEQVTVFCGVPTMYWALLNFAGSDAYDLEMISKNLRICVSGGASLPVQVLHEFEEKYKAPILEGYGLSETSPVACFNHLGEVRKPGSIGTPLWGIDMRVVDENDRPLPPGQPGEIVIRGHNVMKGYYRRPEVNADVMRGDWFHSGDIGKMDEDGYYYIVDRTKDMIIRGGFNVYPREVEEMMMTHPSISMVAVIGVPHDSHGEEIKACVVLKGGQSIREPDLIAWCKDNMASYKYPRIIEYIDSLPMNATGKILKKELRKRATQG